MKHQSLAKAALIALAFGTLMLSPFARANVETDGYGIFHTAPSMIGNYHVANPVPFSDGMTYNARRLAPLQTPETIDVYVSDGYDSTNVVGSSTDSHTWPGIDVTNWSGGPTNIGGNVSLSAGSHGYWAKIEQAIYPSVTKVIWTNALTSSTANITGGLTVQNP
ncbi:MAG: hypothetical protein JWN14_1940 [Chthonomonadales bacterium]|nr:hypothetical protein [Chthonomonadales bacterium]